MRHPTSHPPGSDFVRARGPQEMLFELRMGLQSHEHNPETWREACSDSSMDDGPGCQVSDAKGFQESFGWCSTESSVSPPQPRMRLHLSLAARPMRRLWRWLMRRDGRPLEDEFSTVGDRLQEQEQAWQVRPRVFETTLPLACVSLPCHAQPQPPALSACTCTCTHGVCSCSPS